MCSASGPLAAAASWLGSLGGTTPATGSDRIPPSHVLSSRSCWRHSAGQDRSASNSQSVCHLQANRAEHGSNKPIWTPPLRVQGHRSDLGWKGSGCKRISGLLRWSVCAPGHHGSFARTGCQSVPSPRVGRACYRHLPGGGPAASGHDQINVSHCFRSAAPRVLRVVQIFARRAMLPGGRSHRRRCVPSSRGPRGSLPFCSPVRLKPC